MRYADQPRPEAPRPITVVRDFVNTDDHDTGIDALATPSALASYLLAEGLLGGTGRATQPDLELAHRLRANLRLALTGNHDLSEEPPPALARVLRELGVELSWSSAGPVLQPRVGGVPGALASVGIAAYESGSDGTWPRLKICSFDECEWAYYDHSKNQSRRWCEYGCGNRVKTRALRARRRADAGR